MKAYVVVPVNVIAELYLEVVEACERLLVNELLFERPVDRLVYRIVARAPFLRQRPPYRERL